MRKWWKCAMGTLLVGVMAGCGDTTALDEDPAPDVEEPGEAPPSRIAGTWKVELAKPRQRRLEVIGAALSAEPLRVKGLGKLTKEEKELYEDWTRKQGDEVRKMERKLRLSRARYIVGDAKITVQVDNDGIPESFGPVDYDILEAREDRTVLRFDPGMGNGFETHTVLWQGADRASDRVTANGQALIELPLLRVAGPVTPAGD